MAKHDPGLTVPEPTIAVNDVLWLLVSCLVAGTVSGLITRYLAEATMYVLLALAAVGLLADLLLLVSERGLLLVCLVVSVLVGGVLGLLLGDLLRIVLCAPRARLSSLPRLRVLVATPLWPLLALGGFFRFRNDVFFSLPHILPSYLLCLLGGMVCHVLAAAIALRRQMRTPAAATAAVGERTAP